MSHYKAIFFDLNGTLIDIWTDENREEIFRTIAHLLQVYGVSVTPDEFHTMYYDIMKEQRKSNPSPYPEFDVTGIFKTILERSGTKYTKSLFPEKLAFLPEFLAQTFRAASMLRLTTYPQVHEILTELQKDYTLAAVSDAQKIWAESELRALGLAVFFPVRVISSDLGYRKPARGIFDVALQHLSLTPEDVIFVGNDMFRDVYGAKNLGMKSVYFRSNQGDQTEHGKEPDYIIYRFEDLPKAIRFLEDRAEQEIISDR